MWSIFATAGEDGGDAALSDAQEEGEASRGATVGFHFRSHNVDGWEGCGRFEGSVGRLMAVQSQSSELVHSQAPYLFRCQALTFLICSSEYIPLVRQSARDGHLYPSPGIHAEQPTATISLNLAFLFRLRKFPAGTPIRESS